MKHIEDLENSHMHREIIQPTENTVKVKTRMLIFFEGSLGQSIVFGTKLKEICSKLRCIDDKPDHKWVIYYIRLDTKYSNSQLSSIGFITTYKPYKSTNIYYYISSLSKGTKGNHLTTVTLNQSHYIYSSAKSIHKL